MYTYEQTLTVVTTAVYFHAASEHEGEGKHTSMMNGTVLPLDGDDVIRRRIMGKEIIVR